MAGCVGQPSHFPFPCHFALLFSLVIFFSDFEGPWSPASMKTEIFVSSPPFPVCLSFSSSPLPLPSLQACISSQPRRGASLWLRKKNRKIFIFRFALFIIFFPKPCRIEPHPSLVRCLHSDFAGSLVRNFRFLCGEAKISSCKASCNVRRVDIEPTMVVVRFYYLLTKKVRRVKFSIHHKKLFFLTDGWLAVWASPAIFVCEEAKISSCKASCKVRGVDIEPKMVVVRFYPLLSKKVRRVDLSTHYKKLFFYWWLAVWASPAIFPSPAILPSSSHL